MYIPGFIVILFLKPTDNALGALLSVKMVEARCWLMFTFQVSAEAFTTQSRTTFSTTPVAEVVSLLSGSFAHSHKLAETNHGEFLSSVDFSHPEAATPAIRKSIHKAVMFIS